MEPKRVFNKEKFTESFVLITAYKALVAACACACSLHSTPREGPGPIKLESAEHQITRAFTSLPFSLPLQWSSSYSLNLHDVYNSASRGETLKSTLNSNALHLQGAFYESCALLGTQSTACLELCTSSHITEKKYLKYNFEQ